MTFKFNFPSLKHQAMLSLGRHWINEKALPIDDAPNESFLDEESLERVHQIVKHTKLPSLLRRELLQMVTGIYCNVLHWKQGVDDALANVKIEDYVLDVYGQLDDTLTWNTYFDNKLGQVQNEHELMNLLEIALKESLLPQIDTVLKKIVHLADGAEGQTDLEGPRHEINENQDVLVYSFKKELDSRTASNLILRLNTCSYVFASRERIVLSLGKLHLSFLLFKQHYNLLEEAERSTYFGFIVGTLLDYHKTSVLVDILQFLNVEYQQLLKVRCIGVYVLRRFIDWPYNQFFLSALRDIDTVLSKYECIMLFGDLVERVPRLEHNDIGYGDLLLAFLHNLSPEMKRMFREAAYNPVDIEDQYLMCLTRLLEEKNAKFYRKVIKILTFPPDGRV